MKIAYVIPTLEVSGGAERIIVEKANYLSCIYGYSIYIICLNQHHKEANFYSLSENVSQINLGLSFHSNYKFRYPKRLWIKIEENFYFRQILIKTINNINPDILIGASYLKAEIISSIPCKSIKIIEFHEPTYLLYSDFHNRSILSKLYMRFFYLNTIIKKADLLVVLTKEAKTHLGKAKRVEVIPNFSSMPVLHFSNCQKKRAIAVGRLNKEKGFDRLIEIWGIVSNKYSDWQLDIFGEGKEKDSLLHIIKTNNIKNIVLRGSSKDISHEYANSSICLVTSHYEGFSLVLLEAMKHGVPCVAFDCPYGPRSIIKDKECGYLVENGNISLYAEKVFNLIEDERLRQTFSRASIEQAKIFDTDAIMLQWKKLFESLIKEKDSTS